MKSITVRLRAFIIVVLALTLCAVALVVSFLSTGWITPVVNHYAEPYKAKVEHLELAWNPLTLKIEGLSLGEGPQALSLEKLQVRTGWGFLFGQPIELFIQLEDGAIGYQQSGQTSHSTTAPEWSVAGLSLTEWQTLAEGSQKEGSQEEGSQNQADVNQADSPQDNAPALPAISLNSLQLNNIRLNSNQKGLPSIRVKRLLVGPLATYSPEQNTSLKLDLATAGGTLSIDGTAKPLAKVPKFDLHMNLQNMTFNQAWLSQLPEPLSVRLASELRLQMQIPASTRKNAPFNPTAKITGNVQLSALSWQQAPYTLEVEGVRVNELSLEKNNQESTPAFDLSVQALHITALNIANAAEPNLVASFEALTLEQFFASILAEDKGQALGSEKLALSGIKLNLALNPQQPNITFSLDHLGYQDMTLVSVQDNSKVQEGALGNDAVLRINGFKLEDLGLVLPDLNYQLEQAAVSGLSFVKQGDKQQLITGDSLVSGGKLSYQLAAKTPSEKQATEQATEIDSSAPDLSSPSPQLSPSPQPTMAENDLSNTAFTATGQRLTIQQHQIAFRDLNLPEPPLTRIELNEFNIEQLRWPMTQRQPWQTEFWLNGQSHWQFAGGFQLEPLKLDLKGHQKGLALPDLTPYSQHYAEVVFEEGSMNNNIEFEIKPKRLKGDIGLTLFNPELRLEGKQSKQNIPLSMAFSVLKDSNGKIELSIKLDKEGEELTVGTKAIIKELLVTASQKGAVSYLKYMLQPYGTLMSIGDLGKKLAQSGTIPLEPISFAPLQADLTEQQKDYASKIELILKDKSHLRMSYCLYPAAEENVLLQQEIPDADKARQAINDLNQQRLNAWRRLFAESGFATRLNQCSKPDPKASVERETYISLLLKS